MIHIRAFRAIDEEETCLHFAEGHRKVLEGFNLTNITTNSAEWRFNPNIFVVVAESQRTGNLLGGIRIQIADGKSPLPVEEAVGHYDPKIYEMVKVYALNGGTGELCGLWNSREEAPNIGVTLMLVLAGLSIANQLPMTSIFTIVAQYTLKIALQVGYRVERSLGKNGEFVYPNSNYVARVLSMNPLSLEHSYEVYRERVLGLRNSPVCEQEELIPRGDYIKVSYDLQLPPFELQTPYRYFV